MFRPLPTRGGIGVLQLPHFGSQLGHDSKRRHLGKYRT